MEQKTNKNTIYQEYLKKQYTCKNTANLDKNENKKNEPNKCDQKKDEHKIKHNFNPTFY